MLRDAIYSLLGYSSSLFHTSREKYLNSNKTLSPNCKAQLARVLVIADGYMTLKSVIKKYKYAATSIRVTVRNSRLEDLQEEFGYTDSNGEIIDELTSPGIYLRALCEALENELDPYVDDIESLESRSLQDPSSVPFTHVVSVAEKYLELFHELNYIMSQIEKQGIRGCAILGFLHHRKLMTSCDVTTVIERLLWKCHLIFLNQLSQWLFLGKFADAHKEFIISYTGEESLSATVALLDMSEMEKEMEARSHYHDYSINQDMLPSYILRHVAENILYIGKMVTLCREDPKSLAMMGEQAETPKLSMWEEEVEVKFALELHELTKDRVFNPLKFEITIEAIRAAVIKHSWQYFVVNTRLMDEICLMRDFFLLGRGELFLEFLYKTDCIRNASWYYRSNYDTNCNEAFKLASRLVMPSDELTIEKFTIHFDLQDYCGSDKDLFKDKDGWWQTIGMKYNAKWPMHLIFKPAILENYNKLFNFLLRVKKAQRDLTEVWFDKKQKKSNFFLSSSSISIWQLHNNLIFMVNNLQYYLQVDVIESHFTRLNVRMRESKDFEEIVRAHSEFQANLMSQAFLVGRESKSPFKSDNPMHESLLCLLSLANKFCKTVGTPAFNESSFQELLEEYKSMIAFLMAYMESLQNHPSGAYVTQLYLRLNYNGWFATVL